MRRIAFGVYAVVTLSAFTPFAFSQDSGDGESKWEVHAGVGYHHSEMKYASNPAAYEVGTRYRKGKGSLDLSLLYMEQKVYSEGFERSTNVDLVRYMMLFGYNVLDDFWFDIGPSITFFQCEDDAKNDFGDDLNMPAQPGAIVGFSYRKHVSGAWNVDVATRYTFGNWEIRGPYGQPSNHLRGWEVLPNLRYEF